MTKAFFETIKGDENMVDILLNLKKNYKVEKERLKRLKKHKKNIKGKKIVL
jgi:hypothetical protein